MYGFVKQCYLDGKAKWTEPAGCTEAKHVFTILGNQISEKHLQMTGNVATSIQTKMLLTKVNQQGSLLTITCPLNCSSYKPLQEKQTLTTCMPNTSRSDNRTSLC